jgi:hypothetical protein
MFLRAFASSRIASICSLLALLVVFKAFRSTIVEGLEDLTLREIVLDPEEAEFGLESEVLLPPRSAPPAAPAGFTPRAFRATGATCLLVRSSGPRGPALTERQGISEKLYQLLRRKLKDFQWLMPP